MRVFSRNKYNVLEVRLRPRKWFFPSLLMGTWEDEGTRYFSRMINSPGISQVDFIYIIYTQRGCPRFDIYRCPVYFFDYIKSRPPRLHFFRLFPRIRELASFLSSMTRIDCLADSRGVQAIFAMFQPRLCELALCIITHALICYNNDIFLIV